MWIRGQCVKVRALPWALLVCPSLLGSRSAASPCLVAAIGVCIQVPSPASDLFLCPSSDSSCPSSLLAGTPLTASKGMAVEEGGLQRVRRELAVTLLKEDFPFPSSGQASSKRMSVSWECCLLGIVDHMDLLLQIASQGE